MVNEADIGQFGGEKVGRYLGSVVNMDSSSFYGVMMVDTINPE
jgi:hypothetical protein